MEKYLNFHSYTALFTDTLQIISMYSFTVYYYMAQKYRIYSNPLVSERSTPLMKACDTLPTDTWLDVANPILECSVRL